VIFTSFDESLDNAKVIGKLESGNWAMYIGALPYVKYKALGFSFTLGNKMQNSFSQIVRALYIERIICTATSMSISKTGPSEPSVVLSGTND